MADPTLSDQKPVELLVCTTCRRGLPAEDDADRAGAKLFAALQAMDLPEAVTLTPTGCFSNCARGCSIVLRGAGRWTYVYGNLNEEAHPEIIADGVTRYLHAADGLVPWRERPEHFRKNCIARIPPLEIPDV